MYLCSTQKSEVYYTANKNKKNLMMRMMMMMITKIQKYFKKYCPIKGHLYFLKMRLGYRRGIA